MNYGEYIRSELLLLIPVLNIVGAVLKKAACRTDGFPCCWAALASCCRRSGCFRRRRSARRRRRRAPFLRRSRRACCLQGRACTSISFMCSLKRKHKALCGLSRRVGAERKALAAPARPGARRRLESFFVLPNGTFCMPGRFAALRKSQRGFSYERGCV